MEYYHEKIEMEDGIPARIYYGGTGIDQLKYPLHWHHSLEFDLVLEGCICGKVSGESVQAKAGEVFFVNSGELHETDASASEVMRSITVLLSDELLREYCPDLERWQFLLVQGSEPQRQIAQLIRRCAEIYSQKEPFYELELSIELRRICMILLRECRVEKKAAESESAVRKSTRRIKKAISYMEENYESTLSIREMAEVMGMNPSYFSRFFRQSTGQTFHSYLTWIRLRHALRLLEQGELNVTELALSCGFPNVKSFIAAFRNAYGTTPAKYRRKR